MILRLLRFTADLSNEPEGDYDLSYDNIYNNYNLAFSNP